MPVLPLIALRHIKQMQLSTTLQPRLTKEALGAVTVRIGSDTVVPDLHRKDR